MSKEFALQTFGIILHGELVLYTCGEYFSSSVERNKIGLCSHIQGWYGIINKGLDSAEVGIRINSAIEKLFFLIIRQRE